MAPDRDYYEPEWSPKSGTVGRLYTWGVWFLLLAFLLFVLWFLTGCAPKAPPAVERSTPVAIEDVARAVDRADEKLAEALPLIKDEKPKVLVCGARNDLSEAKTGADAAGKSAEKDAAKMAAQKLEIERLKQRDVVRSALHWSAAILALAAAGLAVAWWFLRARGLLQLAFIAGALSAVAVGLAWWLPAVRIVVGVALLAALAVGAFLMVRWLWTYLAARNIVRSIDAGVQAGVITWGTRDTVKAVLDPIQGRSGKALVDAAKK